MGIRFLHTSDWQLGMTRAFLSPEAQARYTDDQFAGIRRLAALADEHRCAFVVVAGDVFEVFRPSRAVVHRALEALAAFRVPVYLLPGNHDPDNPAGCWSAPDLADALPDGVTVLRDGRPRCVPGVAAEVVGAPWPSRRPDTDLVAGTLADLAAPAPGTVRVLVGHGQVDALSPDPDDPALIRLATVGHALDSGLVHYVALGDRHSTTEVAPRVWYSGAPLATAFDEVDANHAVVVELQGTSADVTPVAVGGWRFVVERVDCTGPAGLAAVTSLLDGLPDKERTAVKLGLVGTLTLSEHRRLTEVLERAGDLFAALQRSERRSDLAVVADDAEVTALGLSGFARLAADELAAAAGGDGPDAEAAGDALLLLARLARRAS